MNRRGNGLDADSYAPLVDLAPRLADAMLEALREAGVAAYAASAATSTPEPAELTPDLTADPGAEIGADAAGSDGESLDRLYVDTAMQSAAEGILHVHLTRLRDGGADHDPMSGLDRDAQAGPGDARTGDTETGTVERDEDAIWAEIVAGYDNEPQEGRVPWPDEENLVDPDADESAAAEGEDRTGRLPLARMIKASADPDTLPPDDNGHYIPPPPPPLPSADPVTKAAWIALVGGPIYLLITVVLGWEVPGWAAFLAVAAFIGGFVTLVLRMGDDPRDPDDGAVV